MLTQDDLIRLAAFDRLRKLQFIHGDVLPAKAIEDGFTFDREEVFFLSRAEGIFRPKQMARGVLSLKTTVPKSGRSNIYSDAERGDGYFHYSLARGGSAEHRNQRLHQAFQDKTPFIYFMGVAPGRYQPIFPCFIESISEDSVVISTGHPLELSEKPSAKILEYPTIEVERRYAVRESRSRLHQSAFREMVISAYDGKCAMTALPVHDLLEAAHIIPDADEQGYAAVSNGICLTRIHHKAFDANLIGIDPQYRIHVGERMLNTLDGPMLEYGIKALHLSLLRLPRNVPERPSPAALERRFAQFLGAQ